MRRILCLIFAGFILYSVVIAQSEGDYEIKVNLKGITNCKVYLTDFYGGNETRNSQSEMKNGEMILKGKTDKIFVSRITFSGNQQFVKAAPSGGYYPTKAGSLWLVIYPGAGITVSGSVENKDFIDLYPKDRGENDYLAELNSRMMPLVNKSLNARLESVKNTNLTAEQKKKLEEESEALFKQSVEAKVNFIKKRPNSIAALWIMEDMLIRSEIEPKDLEPGFAKVKSKKYGNNGFYISVRDRLEGARLTSAGKKCPEIATTDTYDGQPFSDKSMRGKYMLIDFWGTWCGPCMAGIPKMKAFRDKYADKLQILGVSNDKVEKVWKAAIEKNRMNWPNIRIGTGDKDFVNKFNVQGFPTKILIDPNGIIVYRESGENEDFYEKLEKFIGQ